MRKYILMAFLASSVAMPAIAQDDREGRRERISNEQREEMRAARRAERAQRPEQAERSQDAERSNASRRGEERSQAVQQQQVPVSDRANWSARGEQRQQAVQQQMSEERRGWTERRGNRDGTGDQSAAQTLDRNRFSGQQRESYRDGRRGDGSSFGNVVTQRQGRDGQSLGRSDRRYESRYSGSNRQWSNRWRQDRSYDWRNYRDRNRSIFRLGGYRDPYGYGYRRFSIGFNLFPNYYQSNHWLDDPWMYRLPPAYGPYRWVRYYDDALLVNIYSGQVVDVVHSFFW